MVNLRQTQDAGLKARRYSDNRVEETDKSSEDVCG